MKNPESDNWNIKIQLGNWVGVVTVPKARFPEAKAAHQAVLDAAWNWVEREEMKNPELACDWCGDEVANGEGVPVYVNYGDGTGDYDRVCSECCEVHGSEIQ